MSLVGNFGMNYDRTAQTAGVGQDGTAFNRRASHDAIDEDRRQRHSGFFNDPVELDELHPVDGSRHGSSSDKDKDFEEPDTPGTKVNQEDQDARIDFELHMLAKSATKASQWSQIPDNPFQEAQNTEIDPHSPSFKARSWFKSMIKLRDSENKNPGRTAGFAFKNLNAHGFGNATDYQKDVSNIWLEVVGYGKKLFGMGKPRRIDILRDFEGLVEAGEMLVVLGPPGSGCSTFLKTITGEIHGFNVGQDSYLNYQGVPADHMHKYFRGEAIYTAEVDVHFPMLTVGDTLYFAARARAPRNIPGDVNKTAFATHVRDATMAIFGIGHTINTRVGNDYVRGVSGGERKRVSIAEAFLSSAPLQAWDNSTRGLDSANATEFCKTLRLSSELGGTAACVAIYQAPQSAYDIFDKVIVLYEGRQIYFGRTTDARQYFERMGFHCPDRQTDADFLTSMTSAQERVVRKGFEGRVPRTPDEFAARWKASSERAQLTKDIDNYDKKYPLEGASYQQFVDSRKAQMSKRQRIKSPYTLDYFQQVKLCLWRGFRRLIGDPTLTFTQLFGNFAMALILGSIFFNMRQDTNSFFQRSAVLFFAVLMNAFGSALEILTLYAQRPIVEKHDRYALYHPSAEALASMLTDMPYKVMNAIVFNLTLYFMVNLKRTPGAFFFFLFLSFLTTLVMSMVFRSIGAMSRTLAQAMAPAAIIILAIVIFTGFAIPVNYMLSWCRWINYVDPVAYAFESLMVNEFSGRDYACSDLVPTYGNLGTQTQVCSAIGSVPGLDYVQGEAYINSAYEYYHSHKWRNVGIIFAFTIFQMFCYLGATEVISAAKSKGEVLLFRRGHIPAYLKEKKGDTEAADDGSNGTELAQRENYVGASDAIVKQTAIFSWKDVCYDIKIKSEDRRILDHVDGWVKPGTLTALMGVSGAGKTTLLDVLATRVTMGVISGDMLVNGRQRDSSFQRKTGYVQQQDLHLQTSTVREALSFSAVLRQPSHIPRAEKLEYVNEVIRLLEMEEFADAVVGVPGEGLNVEQRKRLTIGVELAAKPELLLFLDEPTSGLDSQTSWAICDLMEKLKNSGQAILCTIHQPSAMLFQRFDRLLFLAKGGRTVYFGEVGQNSHILTSYFQRNGAHLCPPDANPAEWMLEVIGAAPGTTSDIDWHATWRDSPEYQETQRELERLKLQLSMASQATTAEADEASFKEFAAPFPVQMGEVTKRVFSQYWRTPSYIYSKIALCVCCALFIGFIFFDAPLTHQGMQNQMFGIFMLFTIFGQILQQSMPQFVTQRALYEVRERPAKTYSWKAFMGAQILVELPWNALMAVFIYFCYYYPIGLYQNAEPTGQVHVRGIQFFLFVLQFMLFTSSFGTMMIAGIPDAETGGNVANLIFMLSLLFCGVLAGPTALPGFWIFMYRISPFTYLVEGLLTTGLANQVAHCADNEFLTFNAPASMECGDYMDSYINDFGGYLDNPGALGQCRYCTYNETNIFLKGLTLDYNNAWRDYGILWVYIIFNIGAAVFLYWYARVPKKPSSKDDIADGAKKGIFGKSKA